MLIMVHQSLVVNGEVLYCIESHELSKYERVVHRSAACVSTYVNVPIAELRAIGLVVETYLGRSKVTTGKKIVSSGVWSNPKYVVRPVEDPLTKAINYRSIGAKVTAVAKAFGRIDDEGYMNRVYSALKRLETRINAT